MPIGRTRRIPPLWEEGRKEGSWILDASSFSMHINHRAGWGPRSRPFIKPAEICYAANLRVSPPPSPPPPPPRQPSTRRENVRTLEKSQLWISFWDSREENSFFVFSLSLSLFTLFVFLSFLVLFLSCFRDGGRVKCGIRRGIIKFFKSWVDYYPLYLLERTNDVSCSRSTNLLPYLRKPLIRSVIGSKIGILVRLESIFQKYRDQDSIVNAFFFFFLPLSFLR